VPVYVRINGVGTDRFEADLAVARSLAISGILLPKADTAEHVALAAAGLPASQRIVPIVESAAGAWNVLDVARAAGVERLAFGAVDFHLDTGMYDEGDAFAYVRAQMVIASVIAGIGRPIDSVTVAIDDEERLRREAARGRHFGFGGKLCIHPKQIDGTNRAFLPSAGEAEWARRLLDAHAARPNGAPFSFRGTMVDRPVVEQARQIQALADGVH
jgi:citrate lyase subunit beta/citryl-CoA lyase